MDEIPKQLKIEITGLSRSVVESCEAAVAPLIASFAAQLENMLAGSVIQALAAMSDALVGALPQEVRDVFVALDINTSDDQRMEAIGRMAAHKAFSRRALFHPSRWNALLDGFNAYCAERKLTAERAWEEIIRPALIIGLAEADRKASDEPLMKFWHTARREVRREIEKTILDGRTLDRRGEVELPEDENAMPYWFDFEPEGELGEREQELFRRLAELLTVREWQALLDHPTDKASLMARKRAMDKIRQAGIDALVSTAKD
jgi:hypothetical protein